jgi:hypothetical protein
MQQIFSLQLGPVRAMHRASPRDQTRAKRLARFSAIIAETESRALCLHNGRSLQAKNLRSPTGQFALLTCSSLQMFTGHLQSIRSLAKIPTFESLPV